MRRRANPYLPGAGNPYSVGQPRRDPIVQNPEDLQHGLPDDMGDGDVASPAVTEPRVQPNGAPAPGSSSNQPYGTGSAVAVKCMACGLSGPVRLSTLARVGEGGKVLTCKCGSTDLDVDEGQQVKPKVAVRKVGSERIEYDVSWMGRQQVPVDTMAREMAKPIGAMKGGDTLEVVLNGIGFTVRYFEEGAVGDSGAPVRGDVTGNYTISANRFRGEDNYYLRSVHVSPHGTSGYGNSEAKNYSATEVARIICEHANRRLGVRHRRTAALACPKCGTDVSSSARVYDTGDSQVLEARCSNCGWRGTKTKKAAGRMGARRQARRRAGSRRTASGRMLQYDRNGPLSWYDLQVGDRLYMPVHPEGQGGWTEDYSFRGTIVNKFQQLGELFIDLAGGSGGKENVSPRERWRVIQAPPTAADYREASRQPDRTLIRIKAGIKRTNPGLSDREVDRIAWRTLGRVAYNPDAAGDEDPLDSGAGWPGAAEDGYEDGYLWGLDGNTEMNGSGQNAAYDRAAREGIADANAGRPPRIRTPRIEQRLGAYRTAIKGQYEYDFRLGVEDARAGRPMDPNATSDAYKRGYRSVERGTKEAAMDGNVEVFRGRPVIVFDTPRLNIASILAADRSRLGLGRDAPDMVLLKVQGRPTMLIDASPSGGGRVELIP